MVWMEDGNGGGEAERKDLSDEFQFNSKFLLSSS